ncbi:hypothetical protein [Arthrobacter globiformis]|uniref:hypothetical protein n=1 Tax=Arthrobacter globiformis TaxID=1665 RepID=UPI00277FE998|nr:hypothetical protein [Arthrobacter globiformis]MDQ0864701.1 hypothetical protein [Arthrobacter globiformis]
MVSGFYFRGDGAGRHRVPPVMCGNCGTDRNLIIRSVTDMPAQPPEVVLVSYTCSRCGTFDEHPAQAVDLNQVLARPEQAADVLILGSNYMHCRQPMEQAGSELRKLSVPVSTEEGAKDALGVYLSTRVLRCDCGFQMELPE